MLSAWQAGVQELIFVYCFFACGDGFMVMWRFKFIPDLIVYDEE